MTPEFKSTLLDFKTNPKPTAKQRGKVHQLVREFNAIVRSHQILVFNRPFFRGTQAECEFVCDCLGWDLTTVPKFKLAIAPID